MKLTWKDIRKPLAGAGAIGTAFALGMFIKSEFGIKRAQDDQFRWHAKVTNAVAGYCSGFLLDAEWVITAAHCVANKNYDTLVMTGSKDKDAGVELAATHVIRHGDYPRHWDGQQPYSADWPSDFDIALVHLAKAADPQKTSTIQPIDVSTNTYTDAFVSGWVCGSSVISKIKNYFSSGNPCDSLVYTDLHPPMKPQASGFCYQRDRFICAPGPKDKRSGFNKGDSGAALATGTVDSAHAIGIAIHVHDEADVYLRLSSYMRWIESCRKIPAGTPTNKTVYLACAEPAD